MWESLYIISIWYAQERGRVNKENMRDFPNLGNDWAWNLNAIMEKEKEEESMQRWKFGEQEYVQEWVGQVNKHRK